MNSYDSLSTIGYILERKDMRQKDKFDASMNILIDCAPWVDLADSEFTIVNRTYETICRVKTLGYKLVLLKKCVDKVAETATRKIKYDKLKSYYRKKREEQLKGVNSNGEK